MDERGRSINRHDGGQWTRGHTLLGIAVLDSAWMDALPAVADSALWFVRLTPGLVAIVGATRAVALDESAAVGQDGNGAFDTSYANAEKLRWQCK